MESHLIRIFAFLTVALVATHAALLPELYWKAVLPNTPMPKSVQDLLQHELVEDKGTSVSVGKGTGVNVDVGKGKPDGGTNVGVGKGGVSVSTGREGKPVYVGVSPGPDPFVYKYAASESQLHDDPNVALFFFEKDMHPSTKMTLYLLKIQTLQLSCPAKLPNRFPFHLTSSLESMIDFSTSKLGKNVEAISTEVEKETEMQKYTITAEVKKMVGDESVVCHKQNYPYAVFYCHATQTTTAYTVPLEGADGTKAKAVAVCHKDTSAWNPKHLAFQVLKVKPGTVPICHFLPEDHIVWVSN